jgi:hypothetical protein
MCLTLACWSGDERVVGQVVQKRSEGSTARPAEVRPGVAVRDVALGRLICVLSDAGAVRCGETVTTFRDVPLPVPAAPIAAGGGGTCVVLTSGETLCWDCKEWFVEAHKPGRPRRVEPSALPLPKMKSVSVGRSMACGVTREDGVVHCWGSLKWSNVSPTRSICNSNEPRDPDLEMLPWSYPATGVWLAPEAEAFGFPEDHPLSVTATFAWVLGEDGHIRRNDLERPNLPRVLEIETAVPSAETSPDWTVEPSNSHSCALLADGRVTCWGDNRFDQAPPMIRFLRPATQLAVAIDHGCALLADGSVACWGASPGDAAHATAATACPAHCRYARCDEAPRRVPDLTNVLSVRVSPGAPFSCAVTRAGRLWCWGSGYGLNTVGDVFAGAPSCDAPEAD